MCFAAAAIADSHSFAMRRMPCNGSTNLTVFLCEFPTDNGVINLLYCSTGKLGGEGQVGGIVLRHDQASARFLVEPMHNSRPGNTANSAEASLTVMEQAIHEGIIIVARCRMNHQSWGLVDDEEGFVFVQNIHRHLLRLRSRRPGFRPEDLNAFAGARDMSRLDGAPIHANMPLVN